MLTPGKKPKLSFKVDALIDGKAVNLPFADLIEGPTVVSVYMRNNTSACDKQTADLAKHEKALGKQGFTIIGLSRDTCASHSKYAAKHGFKYTLVSDPEDQFSKGRPRRGRARSGSGAVGHSACCLLPTAVCSCWTPMS